MNKVLLILLSFVTNFTYAGLVDLSNWTSHGEGQWEVANDGKSVTQLVNDGSTFFLSDLEFIDKKFEGQLKVNTGFDDDFIGFVFGYTGSDDYLLFDWKQADQQFGDVIIESGFRLAKITGTDVNFTLFTGSDIEVLGNKTEGNNGWQDFTLNDFALDYSTSAINISINGTSIFDVAGDFNKGKFGFYNRSQSDVIYSSIEQSQSTQVPEPQTYLLFLLTGLSLIFMKKRNTKHLFM